MGCPMKFSTSGGMGAALMSDLDNAKNIMKALVDKFGEKISVSCKVRVLDDFDETLKFITTI
jgi:tRNA-dihydrouridine synthase 2